MNYTGNYHLPQWVETDRVQMEDFNQMCADIDQGITEEREAREAADASLTTLVTQAQTTANTALSALPYVVGHYTSDGEERHISVGFRPSAILFHGTYQTGSNGGNNYSLFTDGSAYSGKVSFTDDGFTVKVESSTMPHPNINLSGRKYAYLALK